MDKKKLIIIGIIIIIIAAVILFVLTSVKYEKVYITPNGTTIDVPAEQTKYQGDFATARVWNWNNGILVSYNSNEDKNVVKVAEVSFNALKEIVKKGEQQDLDGFTAYVVNADDLFQIQLFDFIKINYKGKFYCIPLSNETSHDNIIILCNDKDIAVHMAKSVEYKNVFPDSDPVNETVSKVQNITDDLGSKASNYINRANLSKVKSGIEDKANDLRSKSPIKV